MEEVVTTRSLDSPEDIRIEVLVGEIAPRDTSSLLEQLTLTLPLHRFALGHLKRVRRQQRDNGAPPKLELLLCPAGSMDQLPTELRAKLLSINTLHVCKVPPLIRSEYEEWNGWWPTNFRPNEVDREREKGHSPEELLEVASFMRMVAQDAERCREFYMQHCHLSADITGVDSSSLGGGGGPCSGGGIMVNPTTNRIVASCHDVLQHKHRGVVPPLPGPAPAPSKPLRMQLVMESPALLCIEGTALVVNSGQSFPCHALRVPPRASASARESNNSSTSESTGELLPEDAYLCTGLDLYLTHEPNLLCAMALVHSRIRRVFFLETQPEHGALASNHHIHSLRALNHHYRVFQVSAALAAPPSS